MSVLSVRGLKKSFDGKEVLTNINFDVEEGHLLSLLGPSGCGKTTILRIICGLETPDEGQVIVDGKDITNLKPEKRNIGLVFQNYALFPSMNVEKNVGYGLKMKKVPAGEIEERVHDALKMVRLDGYQKKKITKLSGGEQQRVALARALVIQPSILLMDEPLSALDRKIRTEMQYEIRNIQQQVGITSVFVTHDQEEALTMSDKIILLNSGNIEQEDDPWTMYNRPSSAFASEFLGKANLLDANLSMGADGCRLLGDGWSFPVKKREGFTDGQPVIAAVRGEHFYVTTQEDGERFRIERKVFIGATCKLIGKIGTQNLEISVMSLDAEKYHEGDTVRIKIPEDCVIYYAKK